MGVNKVVFGAVSIMDISDSTIVEDGIVDGLIGYGADGEKITGTNPYKKTETDNEVQTQEDLIEEILQELEGKASNSGGIDTSKATVTEDTLQEGVIAIGANGEEVVGSVPTTNGIQVTGITPMSHSTTGVRLRHTVSEKTILNANSNINLIANLSNFGSAIKSKVFRGETFTSADGFLAQGEYEPPQTTSETWVFTMEDGSTVSKEVVIA